MCEKYLIDREDDFILLNSWDNLKKGLQQLKDFSSQLANWNQQTADVFHSLFFDFDRFFKGYRKRTEDVKGIIDFYNDTFPKMKNILEQINLSKDNISNFLKNLDEFNQNEAIKKNGIPLNDFVNLIKLVFGLNKDNNQSNENENENNWFDLSSQIFISCGMLQEKIQYAISTLENQKKSNDQQILEKLQFQLQDIYEQFENLSKINQCRRCINVIEHSLLIIKHRQEFIVP